jgi:predicted ATPase
MLIKEFQIFNYKSYRATEPIQLSAGFNVFIGKNNGGKTALLQALSLSTLVDKPHRHSGIPRGRSLQPKSRVELTVTLTPADLRQALLGADHFYFPVPENMDQIHALAFFQEFIQRPRSFDLNVFPGPSIGYRSYPSHGMFDGPQTGYSAVIRPNGERSDFQLNQFVQNNNDSMYLELGRFVSQSVYSFQAQRLLLASCKFGDRAILMPNAENLAEVLNRMQGRQPESFTRFNSLVRRVFPSIRYVTVQPSADNLEILVWSADVAADRDDLAIELAESGTGIGQVLAMLYIIVTSESPRTIIIDEPNIFLHPGAIRQLIEIMRADPVEHQYIVTTHSPEIIRATNAERVYSVERLDEQSYIRPIISGDITSFRRTLLEVGARISDLFGADHILWVRAQPRRNAFRRSFRQDRLRRQ